MGKQKNLNISADSFKKAEFKQPKTVTLSGNLRPLKAVCHFAGISRKTVDLEPYYGQGFDEIVSRVYWAVQTMLGEKGQLSHSTISNYLHSGFAYFAEYLSLWHKSENRELMIDDISKEVIDNYIVHLRSAGLGFTSQKAIYSKIKSLLKHMHSRGFFSEISKVELDGIFSKNPYPNSNKRTKGQQPFTKGEKRQLIVALKQDMRTIYAKNEPLNSYELTICLLSIAMHTGINTTPLLNMTTNALTEHPLKQNRRLLTVFKARGNATHLHTVKGSTSIQVAQGVTLNVADAIELITKLNQVYRDKLNTDDLMVYEKIRTKSGYTSLSENQLKYNIDRLADNYNLVTDDGKPLAVSIGRIRQTFLNRIYELSGQNILVAAKAGKRDVQTSNNHYMVAPKDSAKKMMMLGEIRIKNITDSSIEHTALANCKDPINGDKAPRTGSLCVNFLGCFRCKSFVVTKDDLYRVYSFYWAIVKGRDNFGRKDWKRHLSNIRKVVDEDIAPQFEFEYIDEIKLKAKVNPHPYWTNLDMLRVAL